MTCLTLLLVLFSFSSCKSQDCFNINKRLPETFLKDWKSDSFGKKKLRIRYLKTFRPTFNPENDLKLKGITEKCIVEKFGKPESIIRKENNMKIYIYFIHLEWMNESDTKDYVGTTLEIWIEKDKVKYYLIKTT